jgi:guanine deaminase
MTDKTEKTDKTFALRGDIVYSKSAETLAAFEDAWVVCEDGRSSGVYQQLPERYQGIEVRDYRGQLIIPGLIDLHTHAPQYSYRCLGMDLELLDWLDTYTFPEEARYRDLAYAQAAYVPFVHALTQGVTTRAVVFATVHVPATLLLMDLLEQSGLVSMVGKVNMDRNAPDTLRESSAASSVAATHAWLSEARGRGYVRTSPILTPRFIPSCTDELSGELGVLQREYSLPVQSHLSENPAEIAWVRELCPQATCYADAYHRQGLLGGPDCPTIMAHCVHSASDELTLLKQQGVWIAHCPLSNTNLASGIAPMRAFMDGGLRCGLGTDVAGGHSLSMFSAVAEAIKASKLRWRLLDQTMKPLSLAEAFYLATLGGGSFFGQVGSFEPGYEFDAVVLKDRDADVSAPSASVPSATVSPVAPSVSTSGLSPLQRLERLIYEDLADSVLVKYVAGRSLVDESVTQVL